MFKKLTSLIEKQHIKVKRFETFQGENLCDGAINWSVLLEKIF
jgi:hypothetical protein